MVKSVVTVGLIVGSLALAACNTVRGAAADINQAANCTENTINGHRCR